MSKHVSIRWKLTLWYGLMCSLTLAALGYGMVRSLQIKTRDSIDSGLRDTAQQMIRRLGQPDDLYTQGPLSQAFDYYAIQVWKALYKNSYLVSAPGQFEQVQMVNTSSMSANPVANTIFLSSRCQPNISTRCKEGVLVPPDPISEVQSTGRSTFISIPTATDTFRIFLIPLDPPASLRSRGILGVLEVFQAEKTYIQIESDLNLILELGIPLALIIALAAGWWIARAALRPIDRISRTVRRIGESRDLSSRLNFVGPLDDEIGRLALTFDGMMDRLEKAFEAQKRFIADASHELRTPLTAIRGNADLLRIAPPEERELCIASIRRESERMTRLVNDLLLLASADADEQPLHMQPVELEDMLSEICRSARVLAGDRVDVALNWSESVSITADPDRLKQLFLNLVDNAIKFTPDGGQVTIDLNKTRNGARIAISDTGVGISDEDREAIFRRFYRVEQARSKRGSGLGLAICAWIVSQHGGHLDVQSEVGKGSTFLVWLPRKAKSRASEKTSQQASNRAGDQEPVLTSPGRN